VPEPILRDAREEDTDLLLLMMEDFNRVEEIAWDEVRMRPALMQLLSDPSLGRVVIAEGDHGATGYAVVTWGFDLEFAGRDAFLTELYVRPTFRRRGEARRLLERVEAIARAYAVTGSRRAPRGDRLSCLPRPGVPTNSPSSAASSPRTQTRVGAPTVSNPSNTL
jgi:GNAT superfamily N-acetyltransferase